MASWRPEDGWNDYAGADVKGKIVVTLVNDPGLQDTTIFLGKILTYYGRWTYKIEEARRQGAAGILMVHTEESATYPWTTVLSGWVGPQVRLETPPSSLVVAGWLQHDAATRLFQQGGQDLAALTAAAAAKRDSRPVPLKLQLDASVRSAIRRSETDNVLGRWPGRGASRSRGGPHRRTLRPLRHRRAGQRRLHLQRRRGQCVGHGRGAGHRRGVRAQWRPSRAIDPLRRLRGGGVGPDRVPGAGGHPPLPLKDLAAILNLDVLNLYGRTRDFSALGLDQSSLGGAITKAAAAEGLKVTPNADALLRGAYFRSDHFSLARVGVPGTSLESGSDFVGRPTGWGKEQKDLYTEKRYHQPSDELQPWFSYDGADATASCHRQDSGGNCRRPQPAYLERHLRIPAGGRGPAGGELAVGSWAAEVMARRPTASRLSRLSSRPFTPCLPPQERFWNCPTSTGYR